ncbi:D-glycero-beta-D-manno-heptose 1,7-bisphosphate 7-phosphatase [Candidatus Viridilinea mediisalina]|uniref:D,D-heptose 1,7-bisphosphate phosphatase n=1 Tax=Candidatus Viridilinea mediisalina TaxID=2024553 RepID=A0A2A6RMR4_9CHLR|nr:D-glycero-beta-D-manno-heptose 1,7-bisphosphate 7-phosphatase [Candidatus Viridilinea mediisalina]PDW04233.1 D-glycero-beta-D-manno-heptose-1,7-bisphosphate 7-phosphatase [Candidatus Viridilinea mediisalina]
MERPAIFLDRDGVINENRVDHVTTWEQFRFLPGSLEALRRLTQWGYRIFVVTNQAAVERGLLSRTTLEQIHWRMGQVAAQHGAQISAVRWCPHRPETQCTCRKPQPGMLLTLAAQMGVQLSTTYMIGDALTDIMAGQAAGCRTILVRTGRGQAQLSMPEWANSPPTHVASDLLEAVQLVELERRQAGVVA